MGVITSFLKLFKPAPNDYVDVEKHLNENYDKIDAWAKDLVVNDLTTGGADKAGSAEMVKKLGTEKLDKGNVPATLNNAEKIVAALQGNGGLKFDPDLLYLNDEGTKKVGYYYLDRLADGIFECLEQTEETINNSAKFRDISNKASADRLDNLFEIYQISIPKVSETTSEVLFVTTIYKSLHPSKELLTVNLCDDLGNVSSETVANIVRSENSWRITISATGNNNKYNEKCLAEMIFIKK